MLVEIAYARSRKIGSLTESPFDDKSTCSQSIHPQLKDSRYQRCYVVTQCCYPQRKEGKKLKLTKPKREGNLHGPSVGGHVSHHPTSKLSRGREEEERREKEEGREKFLPFEGRSLGKCLLPSEVSLVLGTWYWEQTEEESYFPFISEMSF